MPSAKRDGAPVRKEPRATRTNLTQHLPKKVARTRPLRKTAAARSGSRQKPGAGSVLDHMRAICLALPDTKETLTWGQPHFRVGEKIFAGCGDEQGKPVIGFKLEREHAEAIVQDERFWRAPYVGHKGWVSMDVSGVRDWDEVRALVFESYRLIAPKWTLARLTRDGEAPPTTSRRFPADVLAAIRESKILGIRAGTGGHRVIGIWAVVVQGRVFVRSWSIAARGWYRAFVAVPRGVMQIGGRQLPVRAVPTRGERLEDAIDRAYLEKYCTPAALRYARDLGSLRSRATTTELQPTSVR